MNREEILEKSRIEKRDEGMESASNAGRKVGMIAFCVLFIVIVMLNFFNGKQNYAVFALFWAYMAGEAYPKYQFTKQKSYLITTICGGIASLASFASFIIEMMG